MADEGCKHTATVSWVEVKNGRVVKVVVECVDCPQTWVDTPF